MPRLPRNHIKSSFLHVITQGLNKQYIFDKPEDIKYYIKMMYELVEEHKLKIIAYCVMNNHTHMLIKIQNSDELSKYMQRLNTRYGKYYNKKYNRVGYVFRDRYKAEEICDEKHLYNCINYIYNNPVKAGICLKPEQYPFSNYKKIDFIITENYNFIDVEEDYHNNYKYIINNYLNYKKINIDDLKKDKNKLKELIILLRDKYNLSYRKISEEINISREKIRYIYNK